MNAGIPGRLLIVSLDAMGAEDLRYMSSLPNFGRFMEGAAGCERVLSVYPSLTYPAHTSIVTGRMPVKHGIINNTLLQPKRKSPDWFWQRKYIKGTTLYDEAAKKGLGTAALLWPVTAKSSIRWCLPEVLANRPWQNQIMVSAWNSSFFYALTLQRKFGKLRDGVRQPQLDDFVQQSALYTIRTYNPGLLLIHFTDLDSCRHLYGRDHENSRRAMERHDRRLGELLLALERTGDMENTCVAVLGDHRQMDVGAIVYPNGILLREGYLKVRNGKITDYDFVAKNADGSCYLYRNPKREKNDALTVKVTELFRELSRRKGSGIEQVFTGEEAGRMGADDRCVLMLEAAEGYYFLDDTDKLTDTVEHEKRHPFHATHGYLPEKEGYATFFLAKGCGIRAGARVKEMHLWDVGATLGALLDVDLGETDGHTARELLGRK